MKKFRELIEAPGAPAQDNKTEKDDDQEVKGYKPRSKGEEDFADAHTVDKKDHPVEVIGTRHGEKLHEVLCSREEMFIAQDQKGYFRIPSDDRDLNYSKFVDKGNISLSSIENYNSHNTHQLDKQKMIELLHKLHFIEAIAAGGSYVPDGV